MLFRTLRNLCNLSQEVQSLRTELAIVARQLRTMDHVQCEISQLSQRVSRLPQPLRANWVRTSAPAWDRETITLPRLPAPRASSIPRRPVLLRSPAPIIGRVSIRFEKNGGQIVTSFDTAGRRIERYCGTFHDVGLDVLEQAGNKLWSVEMEAV